MVTSPTYEQSGDSSGGGVQALAVGKPLDKMESVPEAAMEGLPSAEALHDMGFSSGPSHLPPANEQVNLLLKAILACPASCLHTHEEQQISACLYDKGRFHAMGNSSVEGNTGMSCVPLTHIQRL